MVSHDAEHHIDFCAWCAVLAWVHRVGLLSLLSHCLPVPVSPARFSVRVLLLLLSGETGQPGAQQHGCCRPGPCAVICPANLAGTCKGKQRIQDNNLFSLYFICASVSRISPKTRESASVKCGQISLWTGANWFDFGFGNQNVWASRETLNNSYLWSLFSWKLLTSLWDWD